MMRSHSLQWTTGQQANKNTVVGVNRTDENGGEGESKGNDGQGLRVIASATPTARGVWVQCLTKKEGESRRVMRWDVHTAQPPSDGARSGEQTLEA